MKLILKLTGIFCLALTFVSCDLFEKEEPPQTPQEPEVIIHDPENCDVVFDHIGYNLNLNDMTAEVAAVSAINNVEIPASINVSGRDFTVTSIGPNAAQNNQRLESIKIPASITVIKKLAFCNCKGLKDVILGEGVETIESEAFVYSGLTSLIIPANVKKISYDAFQFCNSIINITIEDSEEDLQWNCKIGDYGLDKYQLSSVYIGRNILALGTPPSTSLIIGKLVSKTGSLPIPEPIIITILTPTPPDGNVSVTNKSLMESQVYVPEDALEAYKNDSRWGHFWNLSPIPSDN